MQYKEDTKRIMTLLFTVVEPLWYYKQIKRLGFTVTIICRCMAGRILKTYNENACGSVVYPITKMK